MKYIWKANESTYITPCILSKSNTLWVISKYYLFSFTNMYWLVGQKSILKPIFHCSAKLLALGTFASGNAKNITFALADAKIPTCWYLLRLLTHIFSVTRRQTPDAKPKICVSPDANPDASQWNIGGVGSQRKILALAMYISFFVCRFHSRWVANANPISSRIWA